MTTWVGAVSYRYTKTVNAQVLAEQLETTLGLRLMARYEGDATDGYLEARGEELVITCFQPLPEVQRAQLEQTVAAHVYVVPEEVGRLARQACRTQAELVAGLEQTSTNLVPIGSADAAALLGRVLAWDGRDMLALRQLLAETVTLLAALYQAARSGLI